MAKLKFSFKQWIGLAAILLAGSSGLTYFIINPLFQTAVSKAETEPFVLYIPTGSGFKQVMDSLTINQVLLHPENFKRVAGILGYNKEEVPGGKYILESGMTTREVINKLRSGNQDPVNVVVNNVRTIQELCGKLDKYFETDSLTLLQYLERKDVQQDLHLSPETLLTLFIPNTYQMFWTTNPEKIVIRMKKEHDKFWNSERLTALKYWELSPVEAYTLASIVEKESNYAPERATIAGVYLNRLKNGMKLQADPTVVFATGQFDLKRVLYSHLTMDSPYNTYVYEGIPPGPICMPSISALEAVIHAEKHDYIFFCAKADNSGKHIFATTLAEHSKNARDFSAWMNALGIK